MSKPKGIEAIEFAREILILLSKDKYPMEYFTLLTSADKTQFTPAIMTYSHECVYPIGIRSYTRREDAMGYLGFMWATAINMSSTMETEEYRSALAVDAAAAYLKAYNDASVLANKK